MGSSSPTTVTELFDAHPIEDSVLTLHRNEDFLFTKPTLPGPVKLRDFPPIEVISFPAEFTPKKFSPPQGVFECDFLRVEWQQMNNFRQPFYHRNADVDELSFQVVGDRTLMTENGTVELRPGDFSRIPVGVAHDNFGREEIHLLFYIPTPVAEVIPSKAHGELRIPPFEGWTAKPTPEVMTECLGGPECETAAFLVDETVLLERAREVPDSQRIQVLRPEGNGEREWLYKAKHVWIAYQKQKSGYHGVYRRHRRAEEIQYQIRGKRTVVTQRGILDLEPGNFVSIPNGVAFTDVSHGESEHIVILTHNATPPTAPVLRKAEPATVEALAKLKG